MTAHLTHEETWVPTTEPAGPADHGWLRKAFHRIRLGFQDLTYAARRVVELRAPWIVDEQWHRT
jgi:hypothetical protein